MKALILVQGITKNNYILDDVIAYLNLGRKYNEQRNYRIINKKLGISWLGSNRLHNYDIITSIDTEKYLSNWSLFGLWDRFGDYISGNWGKAEIVRAAIQEEINRLHKEYGIKTIDAVGHSYGSQILAGVEHEFNKVIFAGSPITSKHWYVNMRTGFELSNNKKLHCEDMYYLWNKKDRVCTNPLHLPGVINMQVGKGHTFYNFRKPVEDCYLHYVDKILKIKK